MSMDGKSYCLYEFHHENSRLENDTLIKFRMQLFVCLIVI